MKVSLTYLLRSKKKVLSSCIACLALLFSQVPKILAQEWSFDDYVKQAVNAYGRLDYAESKKLFSIAEKLSVSNDQKSLVLFNLGLIASAERNFEKAEQCFKEVRKLTPTGSSQLPVDYFESALAIVYVRTRRFAEAEDIYKGLLAQERENSSNVSAEVKTLINLGALSSQRGNLNESLNWYRQALQRSKALPPEDVSVRMLLLNNIGAKFSEQHEYPVAISCLSEAYQLSLQTYGIDGISSATTLENLANAHKLNGDFEVAETCYKQVLSTLNKHGNVRIFERVRCLSEIADLYFLSDKLPESRQFSLECLNTINNDSQFRIQASHACVTLGQIYSKIKDHALAKKYFLQAIELAGTTEPEKSIANRCYKALQEEEVKQH